MHNIWMRILLPAAAALVCSISLASPTLAGDVGSVFSLDNESEPVQQATDWEDDTINADLISPGAEGGLLLERRKRSAESEASFKTIMMQNAFEQQQVQTAYPSSPPPPPRRTLSSGSLAPGDQVELPLPRYDRLRRQQREHLEKIGKRQAPAVVLGAASYQGEARPGAMALRLSLRVTLGAPDQYKTVPVIGDQVVVVKASSKGASLPLSRQNGYHVWITRETGEHRIELDVLIPATGPRGSIEYDFSVARTPVTSFRCDFPRSGLEPRLDDAVRAEVSNAGGRTRLDATLKPTARIHLVGFKDMGEAEQRQARRYAESLNLLSAGEGALDLFTVIRYSILYAGSKNFAVRIPEGWKVVGADGEGAFRFEIQEVDGDRVLRGETAFPIRNSYELSLRLHRNLAGTGETIELKRPQPLEVERERGWLGVEVPGKLQIEEKQATDLLAVDIRQLPAEMLGSAVSPILLAYRYHSDSAALRLKLTRLPEKDPASGSIDSLRAFSVLSTEGGLLSELRISLRNRLRHTLALRLPDDATVRSTLLDGQPVKPSRDDRGALLLPLKRSEGGDHPLPFTLQVVYEQKRDPLSMMGGAALRLPSLELPVSTLSWSLYLPARNLYSGLRGDVARQRYAGTGRWHKPGYVAHSDGAVAMPGLQMVTEGAEASGGAMPVRIKLPRSGTRLDYTRYWLEAGQTPWVRFRYLRSWLRLPASLGLMLTFLAGLLLLGDGLVPGISRLGRRWRLGAVLTLLAGVSLKIVSGTGMIVFGVLLAGLLVLALRGALSRWPAMLSDWVHALPQAFRQQQQEGESTTSALLVLWRLAILGGLLLVGLGILIAGVQVLTLLGRPLAG